MKKRGQSSIEALLSFSFLLIALSILCLSAQKMGSAFSSSVEISNARFAISSEALFLETAATFSIFQPPSNLTNLSVKDKTALTHTSHSRNIEEPLFHQVSVSWEGKTYVQKNEEDKEPV